MPYIKEEAESTHTMTTQGSMGRRIHGTRKCQSCSRKCYRKDLTDKELMQIMLLEAATDSRPHIKPEIKIERVDKLKPTIKEDGINYFKPEMTEKGDRSKPEIKEEKIEKTEPEYKEVQIGKFNLEATPQAVLQPTQQTTKRRTTLQRGADVNVKKLTKLKSSRASSKTAQSIIDRVKFIEIDHEATKKDVDELNNKPAQTGKEAKDVSQVKDNTWDWFTRKINPFDNETEGSQVDSVKMEKDKMPTDKKEEAKINDVEMAHRDSNKHIDTEPQVIDQKKNADANPAMKHGLDYNEQDKSNVLSDEHKVFLLKGFVVNEISRELWTITVSEKDADKSRLTKDLHSKVKSEFENLEKQFCRLIRKLKLPSSKQQIKYCLSTNDLCNIPAKDQHEVVEYTVSYLKLLINEMDAKKNVDPEGMSKKYLKTAVCDSYARLSKQYQDSKERGIAKVMRQICTQMKSA